MGALPFLKRKTEIIEGGPVDIQRPHRPTAVGPENRDKLRREVEELSKLHLLLPDLLFRTLTLRNVFARDQDNHLVRPKDGSGGLAHPQDRAIPAHLAELPTHRLAEALQAESDISLKRLAISFIKHAEHRLTD